MDQKTNRMVVLAAHPNPELYGADRVFLETVEGLIADGHRVVATLPEDGPLLHELRTVGAEVIMCPTPVLRKSAFNPKGILLLAIESLIDTFKGIRLMQRVRPDVVYVSTVTIPLWLVASRLSRIPALSHVHEAEKSVSKAAKTALALPLLLATSIVANSKFSAGVLTETIPRLRRKISVVYNGVPGPPAMTEPRAQIEPPLRVLYMGRLSSRKGVDVAISAMGQVKDRGKDAHLDILGAVYPGYEWYETELRDLSETLGLTNRVSFNGFHPDIWPFLDRTDVVVVPSRLDEPFGNTAVEAILAGRPLIVSDCAGLREAAGGYKSPQYVAVDSPHEIADSILRIQDDWEKFRDDAVADAQTASARHDTKRYQHLLNEALSQISRS